MKVKVKKRNDPNAQLQPCVFFDCCDDACDWCKTHDYSEACVPMLQQRVQNQKTSIRAIKSVLEEVANSRGRWEHMDTHPKCSICGKFAVNEKFAVKYYAYCPHCGAQMDLEEWQ